MALEEVTLLMSEFEPISNLQKTLFVLMNSSLNYLAVGEKERRRGPNDDRASLYEGVIFLWI